MHRLELLLATLLHVSSLLALLLCATNAGAQEQKVPGTPLERREVVDELGRKVTYYIAPPKQSPAPVMLMIQGSGCDKVINIQGNNAFSTLFNLVPFARDGQFSVVAVEKPFSGSNAGSPGGTAVSCTPEFNEDFTAERWLIALQAVLADARRASWVDSRRTLLFGFSEGAVMASLLAARDPAITDVISVSGSGTTQVFDFVARAYRLCFDASACLSEVERNVDAINANPQSATEFAWGHPYKRWTSFFRVDPGEELLRSKARIYMAFGTADDSVAPLSAELAIAKLRLARRDVTVRRVANGGHTLSDSTRTTFRDLDRELRTALDWFWGKEPSRAK